MTRHTLEGEQLTKVISPLTEQEAEEIRAEIGRLRKASADLVNAVRADQRLAKARAMERRARRLGAQLEQGVKAERVSCRLAVDTEHGATLTIDAETGEVVGHRPIEIGELRKAFPDDTAEELNERLGTLITTYRNGLAAGRSGVTMARRGLALTTRGKGKD
jgi:hypothetical protein